MKSLEKLSRRDFLKTSLIGAFTLFPTVSIGESEETRPPIKNLLEHFKYDVEVIPWKPKDITEDISKFLTKEQLFGNNEDNFDAGNWFAPRSIDKIIWEDENRQDRLVRENPDRDITPYVSELGKWGLVLSNTNTKKVYSVTEGDSERLGCAQTTIAKRGSLWLRSDNGLTMYEANGLEAPEVWKITDHKTVIINDIDNSRKILLKYKPKCEEKEWHQLLLQTNVSGNGKFMQLDEKIFNLDNFECVYSPEKMEWPIAMNYDCSLILTASDAKLYRFNLKTKEKKQINLEAQEKKPNSFSYKTGINLSQDGNVISWEDRITEKDQEAINRAWGMGPASASQDERDKIWNELNARYTSTIDYFYIYLIDKDKRTQFLDDNGDHIKYHLTKNGDVINYEGKIIYKYKKNK